LRGYDDGKKVNGRKRRALSTPTAAASSSSPIRRASRTATAAALLLLSRRSFPFIERVFAGPGYAGERVASATPISSWLGSFNVRQQFLR
jgi:hypothetical protein